MPAASNAALIGMGTKGIAMATPNNPLNDLGTFIGELREFPKLYSPKKWMEATRDLRKLPRRTAEDYLNFEFGWRPLVSELLGFCTDSRNADERLKSFTRNSGKRVRRKRQVVSEESQTSTSVTGTGVYPSDALDSTFWDPPTGTPTLTTDVRTSATGTFTGSFTYYLPNVSNKANIAKRRKRLRRFLLEARPDAETLWNLSPWSWAADWIGNLGDVIHNLDAFSQDGLVMHYGYITYYQPALVTWRFSGRVLKNGSYQPEQSCTVTRIQRVRATPFGFGLNPDSFTNRQWAIIGALGITRGSRSLG